MRTRAYVLLLWVPWLAAAQDRPDEADLFSAPEATDGGDRDSAQLLGGPIKSRFDTQETLSDPLKIGGNLLMTGQAFLLDGQKVKNAAFSAPMILDTYLDANPNDRVRAFVVGRLQFDPARPVSDSSTPVAAADGGVAVPTSGTIGITTTSRANPSVLLDQLWLRFDIDRKVFFTVGRQKVRWGTSRIWYPTDFLNAQPRDALNPFDVRLGVNMVKVHVPVEKLGWNFYGYGLFDNLAAGATGLTLGQLGGALRGEFVLGPAELGLGGAWMNGRRPRYAADLSTALGPVDVYAEAALRSGRDFLKYSLPGDLNDANFFTRYLEGQITSFHPENPVVQVSGGASYQFNYTDKNFAVLAAEYFYNPMGYSSPTEFLAQTFLPSVENKRPDPIQQVPLYGGTHYLALIASAPGLPELTWVTVSVSNIINFSDPSGLLRIDAIFRVLTYLNVQVFASFFYGQSGGELRFRLPDSVLSLIPNAPATLSQAPLAQVGVLLRLSL